MEIYDSKSPPLLLTQWKAYTPIQKIKNFIEVLAASPNFEGKLYLIALPQTQLKELSASKLPPEFILGAKSIDNVLEGTFTASIATTILKNAGAKFVLVGSHESRCLLGDSDESINKKIHRLLAENLQPVLCIGETLDESQHGHNIDVLAEQIRKGLEGVDDVQKGHVVIFYEAPWLLATPKKLTLDDTLKAHEACRQALRQALGDDLADKMHVIYALPEESIDLTNLVEHTPEHCFYSSMPDNILPLVDLINAAALTASERAAYPKKTKIFTEIPQVVAKPTVTSQVQIKRLKEEFVAPAIKKPIGEEKTVVEKPAREHIETTAEEIEGGDVEAKEIEAEVVSKRIPVHEQPEIIEEEAVTAEKEVAPNPELQAEKVASTPRPSEALAEGKIEKETEATASGEMRLPAEKIAPVEEEVLAEEKISVVENSDEDFSRKIDALNRDEKKLEAIYTSMQKKAAQLTQLRKDYVPMSEKAIKALNHLDLKLQSHILQKDDQYFTDHPEKLKEARPAFEWVDKLNEIIMAADAIPKQVDRLKSQATEVRQKLQENWDDLNSHRQEIKKAHPDIHFPSQPKLLMSLPPEIDLSFPVFEGPSPLVNRNVGVAIVEQTNFEPEAPFEEAPIPSQRPEKAAAVPPRSKEPALLPQQMPEIEGVMPAQGEKEELQARLESMLKMNDQLADYYKKINALCERLPLLRNQFPDLLNKMTADLNLLDPALQEQINKGNVAYFSQNPDKAKEASGVLVQLQNLSQLFQETAAIPKDIDRMQSKSRELRKELEKEWDYFRKNKKDIKEKFSDFPYPNHPSQLLVSEPVVDLTPKDVPPPTLGAKKFAVVKAPPLKK